MLNKLPTDENLASRGCYMPSMCSLCCRYAETSFHIFFECSFAAKLWCWFASILNKTLVFQSVEEIWSICNRSWNPQYQLVITATMINIINSIWYARNQQRFSNKKIHWRSSISTVISNTALSGNLTKAVASASISNFVILKKFNVNLHPHKAPKIIEVLRKPPIPLWTKCNTDGSSTSTSSACGGIFRNHDSALLLCFAENTGEGNAFHAELSGAMRAIELAKQYNWNNLWLECDSNLVIMAIKNHSIP
ncbi:putative ribonuclease H-like domain, reverse transcriptase zinc-binding domain-containing protein [Medicago truncatula]|uniref:Putative ribonuclease H-like domain, reverse transcriptase zinc-binding domain-containing protein n=1 Tax=Medicago truncatula TaxID=3880 RepID=A0A396GIF2_MEDTR|nr:putative ribonuclease H-like domain, reverse transcriptase zinc-binding domain-containing protein [Medicago truncatula]